MVEVLVEDDKLEISSERKVEVVLLRIADAGDLPVDHVLLRYFLLLCFLLLVLDDFCCFVHVLLHCLSCTCHIEIHLEQLLSGLRMPHMDSFLIVRSENPTGRITVMGGVRLGLTLH